MYARTKTVSPVSSDLLDLEQEPTDADLAAIDREMPLIKAEIALLDAEICVLAAHGHPTALDWRRVRRAEARVADAARAFAAQADVALDRVA